MNYAQMTFLSTWTRITTKLKEMGKYWLKVLYVKAWHFFACAQVNRNLIRGTGGIFWKTKFIYGFWL